ncbi:MAG TPA: TonB-dependent receptor [Gemmatimonadales bacterium]|nr:TonB-dependent receptor [Gemmatimonadales bacterium]
MLRRIAAAPVFGVAIVVSLLSPVYGHPLKAQDTTSLAPVVVTATRSETDSKRLSSTVSVITGAELRERGFRFVLDWLQETPGLNVVQTGSFGGLTSLFTRGGESDYTKILVDGVPVNQPGGSIDLAHLGTDLIERIEVLRGPASVLYGSDAVSGVIQIVTRKGAGRPRIDVAARFGTFGSADLQAEAAGSSGIARWSAGVTRFSSDGIYPYNNQYKNSTASARLGLVPDAKTDLAFSARWGDSQHHFPTDFAGALVDTNQFGTQEGLTLSFDGGRQLTSRFALRALAGLFDSETKFDDVSDGLNDQSGFGFESHRRARVKRGLVDVRGLFDATKALQLSGGVELSNEDQHSTGSTTSDFGDGVFTDESEFERDRGNTAFYGQALARLGEKADLQAGLRLDDNDVFGNFTTWRLGVAARPTGSLKLHASAGSAFKQPTFSEQFADSPFEVGDPDLVPEESTSWQVGAEVSFASRRVTLSATYFAQQFTNMILYTSAPPGEPTYVNVAEARADGIETGVYVALTGELAIKARYTWLDTEVEDDGGGEDVTIQRGESLIRRPGGSAGIGLDWQPGLSGRYTLAFDHTGSRDDVDFRPFPAERVTFDGYTLVNASADFPLAALIGGNWATNVGITAVGQNLLDEDYESVVGFVGRGRTILLGARLRF